MYFLKNLYLVFPEAKICVLCQISMWESAAVIGAKQPIDSYLLTHSIDTNTRGKQARLLGVLRPHTFRHASPQGHAM